MSTVALTKSAARPGFRPWRAMVDWLAACLARHRSRQDLSELCPHLRRDLGLTAAEVAREVAKPCWRS
ncbi:DUF1127 domain-containing protein [Falsiroseomonas tokyonensis]|uniref:DUF1127 domain-containing protein n=1 Tax=Falsiroseomonas tokyonensis TaxID=430521 RepID=A0ABV7BXZ2_9PROT|nr:hypothetical protein [Falsiroseomonas tokyonensis]MBU8539062.1 hypothetical protein [Falsiroseomonas tokyonensis]